MKRLVHIKTICLLLAVSFADCTQQPTPIRPYQELPIRNPDDLTVLKDFAFSPSKTRLAVHLWKVRQLDIPITESSDIAGGEIQIWDIAQKALLQKIPVDVPGFTSAVFWSPEENHVLMLEQDQPRIHTWDITTGASISFSTLDAKVTRLNTSHIVYLNAGMVAVMGSRKAQNDTVFVIDLKTGKPVIKADAQLNSTFSKMAFSSDGKSFAASDNTGAIQVWDIAKKILTFDGVHNSAPKGTLVAFAGTGQVLIQNPAAGSSVLQTMNLSSKTIKYFLALPVDGEVLAVSPSGTLVLIAAHQLDDAILHQLIVWNTQTGDLLFNRDEVEFGFASQRNTDFLNEDQIFLNTTKYNADRDSYQLSGEIWNKSLDHRLLVFDTPERTTGPIVVSSDGHKAAMSLLDKIYVYDFQGI